MNIKNKKELGYYGEQIAVNFLESNGYEILERNFYCKQGEIDIIAKNKEIVFIEVKTRTNDRYGRPSEAVDNLKIRHICKSARYYLLKNNLCNEFVRFDVIEIIIQDGKFRINHIKQII